MIHKRLRELAQEIIEDYYWSLGDHENMRRPYRELFEGLADEVEKLEVKAFPLEGQNKSIYDLHTTSFAPAEGCGQED